MLARARRGRVNMTYAGICYDKIERRVFFAVSMFFIRARRNSMRSTPLLWHCNASTGQPLIWMFTQLFNSLTFTLHFLRPAKCVMLCISFARASRNFLSASSEIFPLCCLTWTKWKTWTAVMQTTSYHISGLTHGKRIANWQPPKYSWRHSLLRGYPLVVTLACCRCRF